MIMMTKLYKCSSWGNEEELESQVEILHGILQAQRQTAEHMDKLVPENALSIIFDHRSRGVKAQESKPKVETLDLVCCDQTVRIPPLLVHRTFTFFQIRDRWFEAIDQLIESMKEVGEQVLIGQINICTGGISEGV